MPHLGSYIRRERERHKDAGGGRITKNKSHPPLETQNELETNE